MIIITAQTVSMVFVVLCIQLITGCNNSQMPANRVEQTVSAKDDEILEVLEVKIGILFPDNVVLVNSTDGGGRDTSFEFYAWGFFSPNRINMPFMKAPGVKDYLNLPLENTVKFVQGIMGNRKILQPQSAFFSEWETKGYTYRGTLVRSLQGDYLVIEQFLTK